MNKNFIEGVKIIAKYVDPDNYDLRSGHQQIYFGEYELIKGEDKKRLKDLDWFEDEESWSFFT